MNTLHFYRGKSDRNRVPRNRDILPNDSDDERQPDTGQKPFSETETFQSRYKKNNELITLEEYEEAIKDTDRVSKAIFVRPPLKPTAKTIDPEKSLFPITIDNETKVYREKRKDAFKNREQLCSEICAQILLQNQQQSLSAVTQYIRKLVNHSYSDDDPEFEDVAVGIIPAAWVVIGASGNDASISFRLLIKELEKEKNILIAHLEPNDAESEKKLFAEFFRQILSDADRGRKSFADLRNWRDRQTNPKHIIVAIENAEQFPPEILVNFLEVSLKYAEELQIVYILGVLASIETLTSQIPQHLLGSLGKQQFQLASSSQAYDQLIIATMIDSLIGFDIGPTLCEYLEDYFFTYSPSIQQFSQRLKFTMLQFYSTHPFSWVSHECGSDNQTLQAVFEKLASESWACEEILKTIYTVASTDPERALRYGIDVDLAKSFLLEESDLKAWIVESGVDACKRRAGFRAAVKSLIITLKFCLFDQAPTVTVVFKQVLKRSQQLQSWIAGLKQLNADEISNLVVEFLAITRGESLLSAESKEFEDILINFGVQKQRTKQALMQVRTSLVAFLTQYLLPASDNLLQNLCFYYDDVKSLQASFAPDIHLRLTEAYNSVLRVLKRQGDAATIPSQKPKGASRKKA